MPSTVLGSPQDSKDGQALALALENRDLRREIDMRNVLAEISCEVPNKLVASSSKDDQRRELLDV